MGLHIGQIGDPQPVRCRRPEVPLDQIIGAVLAVIVAGGDLESLAPPGSRQSQVAHQALHAAAGHPDALPVELGPHLVRPVYLEVLGVHPGYLLLEVLVANRREEGGRFLNM